MVRFCHDRIRRFFACLSSAKTQLREKCRSSAHTLRIRELTRALAWGGLGILVAMGGYCASKNEGEEQGRRKAKPSLSLFKKILVERGLIAREDARLEERMLAMGLSQNERKGTEIWWNEEAATLALFPLSMEEGKPIEIYVKPGNEKNSLSIEKKSAWIPLGSDGAGLEKAYDLSKNITEAPKRIQAKTKSWKDSRELFY